jgi:hypothetical protein
MTQTVTSASSTGRRRRLAAWAPAIVSIVGALVVSLMVGVPRLVSAAANSNSTFTPVGPLRVLDTRNGAKVPAGGTITVTGVAGASAVAVNITVTEPDGPGFVTAWPSGARPTVSSVNYVTDQTVPNFAIVPTDSAGNFRLFTLAATHIIVDVTGAFSEIPAGSPTPGGGITAAVSHYELIPSINSTLVSGTAYNGTNETITIGIDLQAPTGEAKTTYANSVAPGQTAAWSTYFDGQFTSGVTVIRAYKAY